MCKKHNVIDNAYEFGLYKKYLGLLGKYTQKGMKRFHGVTIAPDDLINEAIEMEAQNET